MISNHPPTDDFDDLNIEVILQRIFKEKDPAAHRAAIWELFHLSGDWDVFERISEYGGERGIASYFQNVIDQIDEPNRFDENISDLPEIPTEVKDEIRELYSGPLLCLRRRDWAGSAAAMYEILMTEIYEVYQIDEKKLPFGEATMVGLKDLVSEEVLFPLGVIEYLAYSYQLQEIANTALLNNFLSLLLTLFFGAQAHLDVEEARRNPNIEPEDGPWNN
jgi:hypothetical protein